MFLFLGGDAEKIFPKLGVAHLTGMLAQLGDVFCFLGVTPAKKLDDRFSKVGFAAAHQALPAFL